MTIEYKRLNPSERTLLGPDVSNASPRARQGLIATLLGATDPELLGVKELARALLRDLWRTDNEATFVFPGPEEAGLEAVLVNLVEPGDGVVACIAGHGGEQLAAAAERAGAQVVRLEAPWGEAVRPDALDARGAKLVLSVHGELSTGVLQPIRELAAVAHEQGALFAADLCATTAVMNVPVDEWQLDAAWSGSQKGLSAFPGLALLTLSPRAVAARVRSRSLLLDLDRLQTPQTFPGPTLYALTEVLQLAYEQGMEYRERRHHNRHEAVVRALETLGLEVLDGSLPSVVVVTVPDGIDEAALREELRSPYRIEIAPGLGDWAGRTWRIGILSHSAQPSFFVQLVSLLEVLLEQQGYDVPEPGRAVRVLVETLER